MGLLDKLFKGASKESVPAITTEKNTVYAPLTGTAITLEEIDDGVFSAGILGNGCGIRPSNETVVAPFDGEVTTVADTKHAVGVASNDGVEILIHVGMDTVDMNGEGFNTFVKVGDKVKCGQKLMTFSKSAIQGAGHPDTTAVVVVNSDDYTSLKIIKTGEVDSLEKLIVVE